MVLYSSTMTDRHSILTKTAARAGTPDEQKGAAADGCTADGEALDAPASLLPRSCTALPWLGAVAFGPLNNDGAREVRSSYEAHDPGIFA